MTSGGWALLPVLISSDEQECPSSDELLHFRERGTVNDADDQREERRTFDERGRDDHRRLNVARHFRLTSHALQRGRADLSDAVTGTDDRQSGTNAPPLNKA